jgi:transposase
VDTTEGGYKGRSKEVHMSKKVYTQEFRDQAAGLVIREGRTVKDVAQSLGVDRSSLRHWIAIAKAAGMQPDPAVAATMEPARRIRELEAQVRRLEMEKDILKKAAAYFAKETQP